MDDLIAHGFERAPPTHKMAVRPIIIFAMTFKARNPVNRVTGADILIKSSVLSEAPGISRAHACQCSITLQEICQASLDSSTVTVLCKSVCRVTKGVLSLDT